MEELGKSGNYHWQSKGVHYINLNFSGWSSCDLEHVVYVPFYNWIKNNYLTFVLLAKEYWQLTVNSSPQAVILDLLCTSENTSLKLVIISETFQMECQILAFPWLRCIVYCDLDLNHKSLIWTSLQVLLKCISQILCYAENRTFFASFYLSVEVWLTYDSTLVSGIRMILYDWNLCIGH